MWGVVLNVWAQQHFLFARHLNLHFFRQTDLRMTQGQEWHFFRQHLRHLKGRSGALLHIKSANKASSVQEQRITFEVWSSFHLHNCYCRIHVPFILCQYKFPSNKQILKPASKWQMAKTNVEWRRTWMTVELRFYYFFFKFPHESICFFVFFLFLSNRLHAPKNSGRMLNLWHSTGCLASVTMQQFAPVE